MEFEELISAFTDGALSAEEESDFLHILSVSPEKRRLFHSYLNMHSAFVADMRSTTVPSHLDAAVLTGARLATTSVAAADSRSWWNWKRGASAALLAAMLFTGGMITDSLLGPESPFTMEEARTEFPESKITEAPGTTPTLPTPHEETRETKAPDDGTGNIHEKIVYRTVFVPRVDTVILPPAIVRAKDTVLYAVHDTLFVSLPSEPLPAPITIIQKPQSPVITQSLFEKLEVEVQREHLNTYPYINYRRLGTDRAQKNIAVFAAYAFNENHAAGLMIGQKAFAQEFYCLKSDSLYLYQQQPLLTYGGGFYRYSLPIVRGIVPQIMMQVGGCDLGPVVGARLAVQLTPFKPVNLIFGVNASLLAYRFNDKMFTSQTLGLLYGLNIHF